MGACLTDILAGGKDSTVLAHVLTILNEKHKYGLDLLLLSIDEVRSCLWGGWHPLTERRVSQATAMIRSRSALRASGAH